MIVPFVRIAAIMATALLLVFCKAQASAADNDDVVTLAKAGVGDETIMARIASEPCGYTLEIADITGLRRAGVSSRVVAAMISKCGSAEPRSYKSGDPAEAPTLGPGVHVVEQIAGGTRSWLIRPAIVAVGRSGGIGTILLPSRSAISLPGASTSIVIATNRPRIWIVSAGPRSNGSILTRLEGNGLRGFEDVLLVQFERKSDRRQLRMGAVANGVAMSGIDPKRVVATTISAKSDWVLTVTPNVDLLSGEYALMAREGPNAYRLYDFSIR